MGLRFRKSIKLGKGVKLNLGKKSVGLSVGGKGARFSVNSKGRTTTTLGIPGTGLSYSHSSKGMKHSKKRSASNVPHTAKPKKEMLTGLLPLIITILFGWLGVHWFISGRFGMGFLYLFTLGLFGIGWFVDIIRQVIAFIRLLKKAKEEQAENSQIKIGQE